jgi:hypothetical protein
MRMTKRCTSPQEPAQVGHMNCGQDRYIVFQEVSMKRRSLVALGLAGAFACSSAAFAFSGWNGYEVRTPSQVDESAPWLANDPHMPAHMRGQSFAAADSYASSSFGTGASSWSGGSGSGGYHSGQMSYGTDASGSHGFSGSHSSFGSTSGFGGSGMGGYTTSPTHPQPLSD